MRGRMPRARYGAALPASTVLRIARDYRALLTQGSPHWRSVEGRVAGVISGVGARIS